MGRYIDDILQPGEKVLYSTNAHWIFYLPAIAAWIVALAFLVLIGVALVADGFKFHIPRGYYFAIAFSAAVELFNVLAKRNRKKPVN